MRNRPVFLNLLKIRLPLAGLISILHRISGIVFFFGFPLLLYMYGLLPLSNELNELLSVSAVKFVIWGMVSAFVYHFLAGVRHMVADFGHNHELSRANHSGILVLMLSVLMSLWAGVLLW